jgi:hypothetical protein
MTIEDELIDNLRKDYEKPEALIGENGLLKQLTKRLLERTMSAELTEHVGYEKHDAAGQNSGNSRNGKSAKTLKGTFGTMPAAGPERDVRAADHREAPNEVHGIRREHHIAICTWVIDARDTAAFGRDLPGASIAGIDLERDG